MRIRRDAVTVRRGPWRVRGPLPLGVHRALVAVEGVETMRIMTMPG